MATTYTLISSVTVGSGGASEMNFTSIPQTYTDLLLFISSRTDRSSSTRDVIKIQLNSSTTYDSKVLVNDGGTIESNSGNTYATAAVATASSSTANTFGNAYCYITNYTSSNNKSFFSDQTTENNSTAVYQVFEADLLSNTAAVTSIKLLPNVGPNFVQYTTAYLYGISNA